MTYPFGAVTAGSDAALPRAEYAQHLKKTQAAIGKRGLDLLLLTGPENIFYVAGQQTPGYYTFQTLCVPAEGAPFLVLRELEAANARANTYIEDILTYGDGDAPPAVLAQTLWKRGWKDKRVAIDRSSWFLSVDRYQQLADAFGTLLAGTGIVEPLRAVKSFWEIEQIEKAAEATEAGMVAAMDAIRDGVDENEVAAAMISAAYRKGSEYVGMEPFVCSGPRSGIRHATWRRRVMRSGELVTLENSACYNRYHAALFRTACVGGKSADSRARDMRDACVEGLAIALEKLRAGNTCADVHNAVQKHIDSRGYADNYRKRTGYSMGISFAPDWGEGNVLSLYENEKTALETGMAFHMPVSLCDHGKFTVCASETAIVTDKGNKVLSKLPRAIF
jgi:Xaa-Pro dipeptidase